MPNSPVNVFIFRRAVLRGNPLTHSGRFRWVELNNLLSKQLSLKCFGSGHAPKAKNLQDKRHFKGTFLSFQQTFAAVRCSVDLKPKNVTKSQRESSARLLISNQQITHSEKKCGIDCRWLPGWINSNKLDKLELSLFVFWDHFDIFYANLEDARQRKNIYRWNEVYLWKVSWIFWFLETQPKERQKNQTFYIFQFIFWSYLRTLFT